MSQEGAQESLSTRTDQSRESQSSQTPPVCNPDPDYVALSLDDKDDPESPPTTSLFLCPSNISALLETATSLSLGVASGEVNDRGPLVRRERSVCACEGKRNEGHATAAAWEQESPVGYVYFL